MNSFYKWWLLNLSLQWLVLGLCSTKIKAEANSDNSNSTSTSSAAVANPHANLCYEAMTSLVGFSLAIVLIRLWGCRPLLTFSQFWTAFMLIIQSLGLYFGRPDVSLFGHLAINISLKVRLGSIFSSVWYDNKYTCWHFSISVGENSLPIRIVLMRNLPFNAAIILNFEPTWPG